MNRKAFRAWLAGKSDDAVVGKTHDCNVCPLGTFTDGRLSGPLPAWAQRFMRDVDRGTKIHTKVTAARALAILDAMPEKI